MAYVNWASPKSNYALEVKESTETKVRVNGAERSLRRTVFKNGA
jgi:hypothetical protein